jgi:hypothetical protein
MQKVKSFSVKDSDLEGIQILLDIEEHISKTGITFSYIVLRGLELYLAKADEVENEHSK